MGGLVGLSIIRSDNRLVVGQSVIGCMRAAAAVVSTIEATGASAAASATTNITIKTSCGGGGDGGGNGGGSSGSNSGRGSRGVWPQLSYLRVVKSHRGYLFVTSPT